MSIKGIKINSIFFISLLLLFALSSEEKIKKTKKVSNLKHKKQTQITITKNDNYTFAITKEKCTVANCNGKCTSKDICTCEDGYLNFKSNSPIYCSYKQKSQLAAFLLELFLPFGIGHLYVGRTLFGITKMIIVTSPVTICLFTFLGILVSDKFLSGGNSSLFCIGFVFVFSIIGIIWWIADLVIFGTNNYLDGNNLPLQEW